MIKMKTLNKTELEDQANQFLVRAFDELEKSNFTLEKNWHIDHLCYRTSTEEAYLSTKKQFESFSKLLIESEVNGRLISTFKLKTPLIFQEWEIDLIEVPAPKKGKVVRDGFEHFEIVCDLTFDEIKARYKNCQFDDSGLAKEFNQELEISFSDFALKFHHLSLESVINIEANHFIFSALTESKILKKLKTFNPLIAGTFPLNVHVTGSDVDVLVSNADLDFMKRKIIEELGEFSNFQCRDLLVDGEPTVLASCSCQGISFEIFGQRTASVKQRGYLHFLVEERLLKVGGTSFAEKVQSARQKGLKTEPAFAKVLGLPGDPYKELLNIQKKSHAELKSLMK